ncbi:hypothetical protein GJ496_002573 [Pomphorhynchus laevis]|nr:hypothetical protein GJ496_002573 [Pomphorhynchus laevis]
MVDLLGRNPYCSCGINPIRNVTCETSNKCSAPFELTRRATTLIKPIQGSEVNETKVFELNKDMSKRYNKATRCNTKNLRCYFCKKIGHVQICCKAKKHKTTKINEVQEALSDDEIALLQVEAEDVEIFQVQSSEGPSISVKLNNQSCVMDYDTEPGTCPIFNWRQHGFIVPTWRRRDVSDAIWKRLTSKGMEQSPFADLESVDRLTLSDKTDSMALHSIDDHNSRAVIRSIVSGLCQSSSSPVCSMMWKSFRQPISNTERFCCESRASFLNKLKQCSDAVRRTHTDWLGQTLQPHSICELSYWHMYSSRQLSQSDWTKEKTERMTTLPLKNVILSKSYSDYLNEEIILAIFTIMNNVKQPPLSWKDFVLRRQRSVSSGSTGGIRTIIKNVSYSAGERIYFENIKTSEVLNWLNNSPILPAVASEKFEHGKSQELELKLEFLTGAQHLNNMPQSAQRIYRRLISTQEDSMCALMLDYSNFNIQHTLAIQSFVFDCIVIKEPLNLGGIKIIFVLLTGVLRPCSTPALNFQIAMMELMPQIECAFNTAKPLKFETSAGKGVNFMDLRKYLDEQIRFRQNYLESHHMYRHFASSCLSQNVKTNMIRAEHKYDSCLVQSYNSYLQHNRNPGASP